MEIREGGFEVTGLPVITRIQVQADDSGFRVIYAGQAYTPGEWAQFTEACVYVRDRLAPVMPSYGPWDRIEDVPDAITIVFDRDGDKWERDRSEGTWEGSSAETVNKYAPFSMGRP